jgi:sugar phosphate isomerase/epimerase
MPRLQLSLALETLGLGVRRALEAAAKLDFTAVQFDAAGSLAPADLSQSGRRELRHLLRGLGLTLTAVGCPLRHGFDETERQEGRLLHVQQVMQLAHDLGPGLTVVNPGPLPEEEQSPVRAVVLDSLRGLARHGERIGADLALETGGGVPAGWAEALRRLDSGALAVVLDPATFLAQGVDPVAAARTLSAFARHAHARDLRGGGAAALSREVALGHGDVDWPAFLAALDEIGYHRALAIRPLPAADAAAAVRRDLAFLRRFTGA